MAASKLLHLQTRIQKLDAATHRISWWRLVLFVAMVALLSTAPVLTAILPVAGFVLLVRIQGRYQRLKHRLDARRELLNRQQAVATLDWSQIAGLPAVEMGNAGASLPPYLFELDILDIGGGERSLLRLLNLTFSSQGFAKLLGLFCSNAVTDAEIRQRQNIISELRALPVLRTRFLLLTRGTHPVDSNQIAALIQAPFSTPNIGRAWAQVLIAQLLWIASVAWYFLQGGRPLFLLTGALLVLTHYLARQRIFTQEAYEKALMLSVALGRFRIATQVLERLATTRKPSLRSLLAPFRGERSAFMTLGRLDRIVGALGVRQNPLAHLLVHLVFPWDLFWTLRLERMRSTLERELPRWQDVTSEFEALASVAEYAEAHPEYEPAELITDGPVRLSCRNARHPLIEKGKAVGNDLELSDQARCILITGSNMSGKSTFLRTIGMNFLLAKAGAPVAAQGFRFANMPLHSSLRISDSLQEGLSSFHAEVCRLKEILDEAQRDLPSFYLIDEIFRGTNNRERLIGSRSFLRKLVQTRACGLVTTHDLELASLESAYPSIVNHHFRESFAGGTMVFSYRKEKGPCPSTNALEVMRLNGLPVDLT